MPGLFGSLMPKAAPAAAQYDPSSLSTGDRLAIFGAMLKDVGNYGQSDNVGDVRQMMAGRQLMQRQQAAQQALAGMFGSGPGSGANSAPMTIEGAAPSLAAAQALGVNTTPYLEILKASQPNLQFVNGVGVDTRDRSNVGKRIGTDLTNVNGRLVDTQDPTNSNLFVPQVDKGQEVVYDARGVPVGVRNINGAVQSAAEMAGATAAAQEGAKASYDLVDVPQPNGSTVKMPRIAALSMLGAGNAPAGFGVSQTPSDKTYGDDTAKAAAARFQSIQAAGQQAPGKIAQYQELGRLLDGVNGNRLSPTGLELSRLGKSMGLNVDPKLGNKEAGVALANQMALTLRDPSSGGGMPGAMSDSDRAFLANMVPNLTQSDQGRKQLVNLYVAKTQRDQDVAGLARKWQQRYGRIDAPDGNGVTFEDQLQKWSNAHPLFGQR